MPCLSLLISFISATSWSQIIRTQRYWSLQWDFYSTNQSFSVINWSLKIIKALSIALQRVHLPLSLSRASSQEHMESTVTTNTCQERMSPCLCFKLFGRLLSFASLEITKCWRKVDSKKSIVILNTWLLTMNKKNLTVRKWKKTRWTCTYWSRLLSSASKSSSPFRLLPSISTSPSTTKLKTQPSSNKDAF